MANWALLQEQLTGKQVTKRAKYGIHFDNGDGQTLAHFSGKPCHWQDTDGLWKPIDTRLVLMPDGFYGCPHSPVRVHKDGHVKVTGSDYTQYAGLPSASEGLVDGDKIVRIFRFGEQRLWVTEGGFHSEIVLNRIPTLSEAKKLIASEGGTLPRDYWKSLTTATDANDNIHTFTTLSAFRTWLTSAAFPVVIDPDFVSAGGSAKDTSINSAYPDTIYTTNGYLYYGETQKVLMHFDLSSVDSGSITSAASITLTNGWSMGGVSISFYGLASANADWRNANNPEAPTWNHKRKDNATAWAGSAGCSTAGTDYINTLLCTFSESSAWSGAKTHSFNSDGLTVIDDWYGETSNSGFISWATSGSIQPYSGDYSSGKPTLSVTYSAPSTGTLHRINMNAQMSNLTGGFYG